MTSCCHIREARPGDADALSSLYRQLIDDGSVNVLPEAISGLRSSPLGFLLVTEDENRIVGTALLAVCQDVMYGLQPFAVIENFVVDHSCLRSGIGSLLMTEIEQITVEQDCSKILLSSSRARLEAHQFFQKHGFSDQAKVGFVKYRFQLTSRAEQGGADQPATAPESNPEANQNPRHESEVRPQ
ncbi:MAG: GNAT family N-acetyltransferase [Verrucomicrobiota bacterium]